MANKMRKRNRMEAFLKSQAPKYKRPRETKFAVVDDYWRLLQEGTWEIVLTGRVALSAPSCNAPPGQRIIHQKMWAKWGRILQTSH